MGKRIKGLDFEHKEIGQIAIEQEGTIIGVIGEKSDLMWQVFYYDFIVEQEEGTVPTHSQDHDNYLTLQIWNTDQISADLLDNYVQEILYNCSIKMGLNFKVAEVNELYRDKGMNNQYVLDFKYKSIESVPLFFYNSTLEDLSVRLKFLSYYQVIEYYFVRANNFLLKEKLINADFCVPGNFDSSQIREIIQKYNIFAREREAIKLVLGKAIDIAELSLWLNQNAERLQYFTQNADPLLSNLNLDLSKAEKRVFSKLCERIYSLRCSIVHSKADIEEIIYIPNINDAKLINEMPLMSFVAQKVLEVWGTNSIL